MDDEDGMDALFNSFMNEVSNIKTTKMKKIEGSAGTPEEIIERVLAKIYDPKQGYGSAYDILQVTKEASENEITKAYRRLAVLVHPDKCKLDKAEEAFQVIVKAYNDTKDPNYVERPASAAGSSEAANEVAEANKKRYEEQAKERRERKKQEQKELREWERNKDKRAAGWQIFMNNVQSKKYKTGHAVGKASGRNIEAPAQVAAFFDTPSQATKRLRLAKAAGTRPLLRDVILLRHHHGHMGGKSWQHSQGNQAYRDNGRYWRGAYRTWSPQAKDKNKFPAYDQVRLPRDRRTEDSGASASVQASPGHVQMIQTSINNARKAETKVASIEERIAERKAQWDVYLEDIKAAWVRESQRHEKDMARMREELATAVRYQDTARAELRDVHQAVVRGQTASREQADYDGTWYTMMQQWQQENTCNAPEAILARAMTAGADAPLGRTGVSLPPPPCGPPPGFGERPSSNSWANTYGACPLSWSLQPTLESLLQTSVNVDAVANQLAARRVLEPFGGRHPNVGTLGQIDPNKRPVQALITEEEDDDLQEIPPEDDPGQGST
ncbi:Dnajc8 [Symbiodinium sp. KB8]|nr:Dnajc8 [Symbiodinium sp. KB8]